MKGAVMSLVRDTLALQFRLEAYRGSTAIDGKLVSKVNLACIELLQAALIPSQNRTSLDYIETIKHCIAEIIWLFDCLVEQRNNFFGTFNPHIAQSELMLFMSFLGALSTKDPEIVSSLHQIAAQPSGSSDDSAVGKENLYVKLFWWKHFSSRSPVTWKEFTAAFTEHYGEESTHRLDRFHNLLQCVSFSGPSLASSTDSLLPSSCRNEAKPQSEEWIDVHTVHRVVANYRTLFEAYEQQCDPQTMVVMSGRLIDRDLEYPMPQPITELLGRHIVSISCGDHHACVVTIEGWIFAWGDGGFGRLGLGDTEDRLQPTLVPFSTTTPMTSVVCGYAFTAAISRERALYTWGAGMNGRLGSGSEENQLLPQPVEGKLQHELVASVHLGSVHAAALTTSGSVYTFGKSDYCGHGESEHDILIPRILPVFTEDPAIQVSVGSGGFHTLVLTRSGRVYSWGFNRTGQLGLSMERMASMPRNASGGCYQPTPALVNTPERVVQVAAGWGHSALVTAEGHVYVCGRNVEGQLGLGESTSPPLPLNERGHCFQPTFIRVPEVSSSSSPPPTPQETGSVPTTASSPAPVLYRKRISEVRCGGGHSILFSGAYDVLGVGWGERGELFQQSSASTVEVLEFFQREKRAVRALSCSSQCNMVLLGKRAPSSLHMLCSNTVRSTTELWQDLVHPEEEDQEMCVENCAKRQKQQQSAWLDLVRSSLV